MTSHSRKFASTRLSLKLNPFPSALRLYFWKLTRDCSYLAEYVYGRMCLPDDMKHERTRSSTEFTENRFVLQFKPFQSPKSCANAERNVNAVSRLIFTIVAVVNVVRSSSSVEWFDKRLVMKSLRRWQTCQDDFVLKRNMKNDSLRQSTMETFIWWALFLSIFIAEFLWSSAPLNSRYKLA